MSLMDRLGIRIWFSPVSIRSLHHTGSGFVPYPLSSCHLSAFFSRDLEADWNQEQWEKSIQIQDITTQMRSNSQQERNQQPG